ncbi:hypothetical protein CLUG_05445 [Clavispora lusitaniae ATCC 42720]|uniref:Secreted protein n=1 Tax=Clavispora lusitaniae (strain ATCC 42720) TaxID=306902 RepID=C4YAY0_CLAL4|nr:uncharacterized protein CLUG_05445 [Clavispora lusitaniae ATCC 42720]EEQ41318.1 hypothetical protein CLUG_05445 [Clavispora lusitaniae ATCC 42720]
MQIHSTSMPILSVSTFILYLCGSHLTSHSSSALAQLTASQVQHAVVGNVHKHLQLGIWLQVRQHQTSKQVAGLVHNLTADFWLVVRLRVRGWLSSNLRLFHGTSALVQLHNHICRVAVGHGERLADRVGSLSDQKSVELSVGVLDSDRLAQMSGVDNNRSQGLVDLLGVKAFDQRSLQSSTFGRQLLWVGGTRVQRRSHHGGGLGEKESHVSGQLDHVGASTGQQNLVDVQSVDASLGQHQIDKRRHVAQGLSCGQLKTQTVDVGEEIEAVGQRLDGERRRRDVGQGFLGHNGLGLQLGHGTGVLSWVGQELLLELFGKVLGERRVQSVTAQAWSVCCGQDGQNAATDSNDSGVGTDSTKISNHIKTVLQETVFGGQVRQQRGRGLVDGSQHIEARILGDSGQKLLSVLGEVRWHREHHVVDALAQVVLGSQLHSHKVSCGSLLHRNELGLVFFPQDLVGDSAIFSLDRWSAGGSDRKIHLVVLLSDEVSEVDDGVGGVS